MKPRSEIFKAKVQQSPDNLLFQFSLAQALFEEGDYLSARAPLEFCLEKQKDWMMARILYGRTLLELGEIEPARSELIEALRLAEEQNHEDPAEEVLQLLEEIAPQS